MPDNSRVPFRIVITGNVLALGGEDPASTRARVLGFFWALDDTEDCQRAGIRISLIQRAD